MHDTVKQFVSDMLEVINLKDPWILEIGSRDVNGTIRELFPDTERYAGIDILPGKGVDYVCTVDSWAIDSCDLVLCIEMLEHDKFPWITLRGVFDVLKENGYLILTARAFDENGCWPMHELPDYHRFTLQGIHWLLHSLGFDILKLEADPDEFGPGVFVLARKPTLDERFKYNRT